MKKHAAHLLSLVLLITACDSKETKTTQSTSTQEKVQMNIPEFNADTAYQYIAMQVAFGPRVPNTKAHIACGDFLSAELKKYGASVYEQKAMVSAFDQTKLQMRNIIAAFHPEKPNRILLCAHWDTRPFADQDITDQNKAIDGANDGGSGVAVLLEIARHLSLHTPEIGIDIIFFDAEDYGQPDNSTLPRMDHSYCLGSQYWAKNPSTANYRPAYGILLDMVGGANARFTQEEISRVYASNVLNKVWATAVDAGYSDYFSYQQTNAIIDDHYYINTLAQIPTIDIIHHDASSVSGFWKHWHTHEDRLENIDKRTLKAVGQTLLNLIYQGKAI